MIDDEDLLRNDVQGARHDLANAHQVVKARLLLVAQVVVLAHARKIGGKRWTPWPAFALVRRDLRRGHRLVLRNRDRQRLRKQQRLPTEAFRTRAKRDLPELGELLAQRFEYRTVLAPLLEDDCDQRIDITRKIGDVDSSQCVHGRTSTRRLVPR